MTIAPLQIIRISEAALIQIILTALEAYTVPHKVKVAKRRGVETIGQLWGHSLILPNGSHLHAIEAATPDTSAERSRDAVIVHDDALDVKIDVVTSFFPQFSFMGDFHTHPYPDAKVSEVDARRMYRFSEVDHQSIEAAQAYYRARGYKIGLVMAIAETSRTLETASTSATIRFSLGRYCLWLHAVAYEKTEDGGLVVLEEDETERLILECPAICGLTGAYSEFGRRFGKGGHQAGDILVEQLG